MFVSTLASIQARLKRGRRAQVVQVVSERDNGAPGSSDSWLSSPGSRERVHEMLRQATEDARYLKATRQRLMTRYPNQWIAIYKRKVVARTDTPEALVRELAAEGVDPAFATIHHLSIATQHLIL
jgi:hypothetical protein